MALTKINYNDKDNYQVSALANEYKVTASDMNEIKTVVNSIIDALYPVGAIYISTNNTNPGTIFGGTWQQIQDKFLLGAGTVYTAGSTGGQDRASVCFESFIGSSNTLYNDVARQDFTTSYSANTRFQVTGSYAESSSVTESQTYGLKVANLNNGDTLMPPYIAVYIWQRTA